MNILLVKHTEATMWFFAKFDGSLRYSMISRFGNFLWTMTTSMTEPITLPLVYTCGVIYVPNHFVHTVHACFTHYAGYKCTCMGAGDCSRLITAFILCTY